MYNLPAWHNDTPPGFSADNFLLYNTAINDIDSRLRAVTINVRDYGAVGDGVADDTTAIRAALAAVPATGAVVYFPAGTYLLSGSLTIGSNTWLIGAGVATTTLKKTASFAMLQFWGSAAGAANHISFSGARDMTLLGNSQTGTLLDLVYCSALAFYNIHCFGNLDIALDTVEVYDSRFYNVTFDWCGGTSTPAVRIGAARTASGFGSSTDSTNQLMFFGLRVETWCAGAISINPGVSGTVQQIYFYGIKIESVRLRAPAIDVSGTTRSVYMNNVYVFMGNFDSGFSTAQNAVNLHGDRNIQLTNAFIANGSVATVANGVDLFNSGAYVDMIHGDFTTAPTSSLIRVSGGSNYTVGQCTLTGSGTLVSGNVVTSPLMSRPTRSIAGAVSDSSFPSTPYVGSHAVDITNNRWYVKTAAGTWHYTQLDDAPVVDIQVFTSSGTWTKPTGVNTTTVTAIGGGGGGGSGARRASGTATSGGAGGGSGAFTTQMFRSVDLGSTETVTVGTGGAGGTAITANDTNGNAGAAGGASAFGTSVRLRSSGGIGGGGGSTSAAAAGAGGSGLAVGGGGGAGNVGAVGSAGGSSGIGAGGGGAGGVSTTPAAFAGAAGSPSSQLGATGAGTAGAIDGAGGAGGAAPTSMSIPGGGGGGGGSSITTTGGTGGAGGLYGAGGGGGGSSLNGQNSGVGGAGANGIVVVISR